MLLAINYVEQVMSVVETSGELADMRAVEDLRSRYARLYGGAIYDVLDELGYPNQVLATDLAPIEPGSVVIGPAFTIQGVSDPLGDEELSQRRIRLFSEMRYPCVDVRDCGFDVRVAHYGEMNATLGVKHGAVGAIVDGGVRDVRLIREMGFPVYARYRSPVEAKKRWSYYRWQVPITLRGAMSATVTVHPGDFMFADQDGVLVIPRALTVQVLEAAERLARVENSARSEFTENPDTEAVYRKYGRL
ncbi:RraA family protein [Sphingomonas sp. CJ99]